MTNRALGTVDACLYGGTRLYGEKARFAGGGCDSMKRLMERALMSPAGYRYLLDVAPRIDKVLIPRTHGRLSSAGIDRVGLVTTTGAKSGLPRTHALVLIDDSDGLLAIGSNYGRPPHPAWSTNLLAHPECTVEFKGPPAQYRAELLSGDARASALGRGHRLLCRLRALPSQLRTTRDQALPPSAHRGLTTRSKARSNALTARSRLRRCFVRSSVLGVHGLFNQPSMSDR